jgi:hypothetical protein
MYKKYDLFDTPSDNTHLWRYMDLPRYLSILLNKSLWFSVPSCFEDPWEGRFPPSHSDPYRSKLRMKRNGIQDCEIEELLRFQNSDYVKKIVEEKRNDFAFLCWHESEKESLALWKLYAKDPIGIAIVTTIDKLKASVATTCEDIFIGRINYIDRNSSTLDEIVNCNRFTWKDSSYSYENEVRAASRMSPSSSRGIYIPVDINVLIENIFISPMSPDWSIKIIEDITLKYGICHSVKKSDLLSYSE